MSRCKDNKMDVIVGFLRCPMQLLVESLMPTLQTVGNEGASTQMFGGRRYEILPMQDYQQSTAEYFASAKHRREGGWYLALDAGNGTAKNTCPYQNKFGEKSQNMNGIVTTAEYRSLYYCVHLVTYCVHLDTLNINYTSTVN